MTLTKSAFGLNFYGYFIFAACWVIAYFAWAWQVNRREARRLRDDKRTPG